MLLTLTYTQGILGCLCSISKGITDPVRNIMGYVASSAINPPDCLDVKVQSQDPEGHWWPEPVIL